MEERNHFVTMNQMSFIDYSHNNKISKNLAVSQSRTLGDDLSEEPPLKRDHSHVQSRSKSPNMLQRYKSNSNIVSAGVRNMNPTLYSKPWREGTKNKKFRHPNLQSNAVFYNTSPNMRGVEENRFTTTSKLMQSFGRVNNNPINQ